MLPQKKAELKKNRMIANTESLLNAQTSTHFKLLTTTILNTIATRISAQLNSSTFFSLATEDTDKF